MVVGVVLGVRHKHTLVGRQTWTLNSMEKPLISRHVLLYMETRWALKERCDVSQWFLRELSWSINNKHLCRKANYILVHGNG